MLNADYKEMLQLLSDAGAEYLVVGAYAMAAHGYPRATGDIDILINPTPENAHRVRAALKKFGAPLGELSEADLATEDLVFQIGVAPNRIDILTSISGVTFAEAARDTVMAVVDGQGIPLLSPRLLVRNKEAVGRPRDIEDANQLRRRFNI